MYVCMYKSLFASGIHRPNSLVWKFSKAFVYPSGSFSEAMGVGGLELGPLENSTKNFTNETSQAEVTSLKVSTFQSHFFLSGLRFGDLC